MNHEFPLDESIAYLNHAAVSPWPLRTAQAVERFARDNTGFGAAHYPDWLARENKLRAQLAWLIKVPATDDIALLKNTSEALSTVAYGIDWRPGDNVVTFRQEFPSNRVVWQSLQRFGVETRLADITSGDNPEQSLINCCDRRTRLVSSSSVQYATGLRIDLERIGEHCQRNQILFCVDAIQTLGAIPFDARQVQADFVVADGHKWMMGPEGLALFYSRAEARAQLQLNQYGWHMLKHCGDFDSDDWTPTETARRFECGSPNMLGIHALSASLDLIKELGVENICRQLMEKTGLIIDLIEASSRLVSPLSDKSGARRSGIVCFRIAGVDQQTAYRQLMQAGVVCACRGGGIRFSPHYYTRNDTIKRAWKEVLSIAEPSR